jgi:uncharacterized protein
LYEEKSMKSIAAFFLILLASGWVIAQEYPSTSLQANTVSAGAEGKFEAPPDTALIQFNIAAQADTSRGAFDQASKDAEQVRQILRSNGIEPKSAEIGFFSIQPVYDYKNAKRKLVAYQVTATVTLKLRDFTKIAPILQQLADGNVSDNQSVNYTLENIDAAKAKAVEDAYRHARESAVVVATAAGRSLGDMTSASVDSSVNIQPIRPMMAMARMSAQSAQLAAPTEEFSAQNITATAHVNAIFALK